MIGWLTDYLIISLDKSENIPVFIDMNIHNMNRLWITMAMALIAACSNKKESSENELITEIETAHHKEAFLSKPGITYHIQLGANGNEKLSATVWMRTNWSGIRMDMDNGISLIYDGENVYKTPADAEAKGARFNIFTWPYFFALPYKLDDPGANWEPQGDMQLNQATFETGKLTFDPGVGDAPDDWYLVYADPDQHLVRTAAYIVTYGKSTDKANEDPHAISYESYELFDDIPIATEWTFWQWREDEGLVKALMKGRISDVRFAQLDDSLFTPPEDSKRVEAP